MRAHKLRRGRRVLRLGGAAEERAAQHAEGEARHERNREEDEADDERLGTGVGQARSGLRVNEKV